MNVNSNFVTIGFHGFPVLCDLGLILRELAPGDSVAARWKLDHLNAIIHGTHVIAEAAANAILFSNLGLGTRLCRFTFAV
jgi:hypothetical protein